MGWKFSEKPNFRAARYTRSAGERRRYPILSPHILISSVIRYSVLEAITSHSISAQDISALRGSVSQAALTRPLHARYKGSCIVKVPVDLISSPILYAPLSTICNSNTILTDNHASATRRGESVDRVSSTDLPRRRSSSSGWSSDGAIASALPTFIIILRHQHPSPCIIDLIRVHTSTSTTMPLRTKRGLRLPTTRAPQIKMPSMGLWAACTFGTLLNSRLIAR